MAKLVIDPASGWKYGFPSIWDDDKETYEEFLDRHNYPENLRHLSVRQWYLKNEQPENIGVEESTD